MFRLEIAMHKKERYGRKIDYRHVKSGQKLRVFDQQFRINIKFLEQSFGRPH